MFGFRDRNDKPCTFLDSLADIKLDDHALALLAPNRLNAGGKHHSYLSISLDDQATVWLPQ